MSYIPGDVILYKYRVEKWLNGDLYQVTQMSRNARRMLQVVSLTDEHMTEDIFRRTNDEFQAAVRLSDQISHPNLLKVLDSDASGDRLALLMEDMPGGSLADRLAKVTPGTAAVSPSEAVALGTQIAAGLQALHSRGYIHGDLQPSNIFLDGQGHVKLGGLGKAKMAGYSFDLFPAPVTAPSDYLSPEQKAGSKNLTFASDIYSLGCIMFGLLSGRVYTRQQPVTKVSAMLIKGPEWLSALILHMLSPDPSLRPADGGSVTRLIQAAEGKIEALPSVFPDSQISSGRAASGHDRTGRRGGQAGAGQARSGAGQITATAGKGRPGRPPGNRPDPCSAAELSCQSLAQAECQVPGWPAGCDHIFHCVMHRAGDFGERVGQPSLHKPDHCFSRLRTGEEKALRIMNPQTYQGLQLRLFFYPFCDHIQA